MKDGDERLSLVEQLIAQVRIACRKGDPDTILFAAEVLRDLENRKRQLTQQLELPVAASTKERAA